MFLTREEEAMLNGEVGEGVREAMEALVKTGEFMGAKNMVPIEAASISSGCLEDYGMKRVIRLAELGAKFRVPTRWVVGRNHN